MPWISRLANGAAIWFSSDPILSLMRKPRTGIPLKCVTILASDFDSSKQANSVKLIWSLKSVPYILRREGYIS